PNPLASVYHASVKGKVVLDICRYLVRAAKSSEALTSEFLYVLEMLGLRHVNEPISMTWLPRVNGPSVVLTPEENFKWLMVQSLHATNNFGIAWDDPFFVVE
ncbi:hypothetical protein, partial [Streptomyces kebangsaanensis]|uniref:hypothetical protein n=1 Tax=Streptomyces kebangsaanensis TaxID=864058 RepID=UPI001F340085